jgi:hypothetical protein
LTPPKAEQAEYCPICDDDLAHCPTCGYQCHNCGYELSPPPRITKVDARVLDELVKGSSIKEIAASLGKEPRAIKAHITKLGHKLHINPELTHYKVRLGTWWSCELFRIGAGYPLAKAGRSLD